MKMKPLRFVGSSLDDLRNFPDEARRAAGFELHAVQSGFEPSDWKPMPIVGSDARKFVSTYLGSGGLFMSPSFKKWFMCYMPFIRKREKQASGIWSWPANGTSKLEDKL
jgi:hypothetical protein